ncbi:hypothetical protein FDP41_000281 [Naegleria fowleri]|uniref:Right handed beta helix domain-containing protein n=1 Tax=Naegleria fowleri TaxID=5763 RepID=A0A6A5CBG5_NAEFO|nr:uncharacterized protein FDP41_000281 [Naegleria fowleri]KAF0984382.1 hypothetical protein FDP41_000281 [Naegleria fowleri]
MAQPKAFLFLLLFHTTKIMMTVAEKSSLPVFFVNNVHNPNMTSSMNAEIESCTFFNNTKTGALWGYPLAITTTKFVNYQHNNNIKEGSDGGSLFLSHTSCSILFCRFIGNRANNSANYAGGCIFIEHMMGNFDHTQSLFEGNSALSYGNDTAGPLRSISYEISVSVLNKDGDFITSQVYKNPKVPQLHLYPGYLIPYINVSIWDNHRKKITNAERRITIQQFESNIPV